MPSLTAARGDGHTAQYYEGVGQDSKDDALLAVEDHPQPACHSEQSEPAHSVTFQEEGFLQKEPQRDCDRLQWNLATVQAVVLFDSAVNLSTSSATALLGHWAWCLYKHPCCLRSFRAESHQYPRRKKARIFETYVALTVLVSVTGKAQPS
ncbi:hypothetical protein BKA81DRAFT_413050 [Phyllosticta paracitricarpa]